MSQFCKGCAYQRYLNGYTRSLEYDYCAYIFVEDKRRPCPPGEGCTEKISRSEWRNKNKFKTQEDYEKYWARVRERRRIAKMKWYNKNKEAINAKIREKRRMAREG